MRRELAGLALALCASAALAQLKPEDPDWREADAPPPPALRTDKLIGIDMPGSTLRFGVDPASISVGADGIVRYVVVATSASGAVNGIYEGVRCDRDEYRVYARHTPGSGWSPAADASWRSMHDRGASRHTLVIARNGVCIGQSPNMPASQIARDLARSADYRFRPEIR